MKKTSREPRYQVCTIGSLHYVQHVVSLELMGLGFRTKRAAQASVDDKNSR